MNMKNYAHKIGAIMYFIWGLLHLKAAFSVYQLGSRLDPGIAGPNGRVCDFYSPGVSSGEHPAGLFAPHHERPSFQNLSASYSGRWQAYYLFMKHPPPSSTPFNFPMEAV